MSQEQEQVIIPAPYVTSETQKRLHDGRAQVSGPEYILFGDMAFEVRLVGKACEHLQLAATSAAQKASEGLIRMDDGSDRAADLNSRYDAIEAAHREVWEVCRMALDTASNAHRRLAELGMQDVRRHKEWVEHDAAQDGGTHASAGAVSKMRVTSSGGSPAGVHVG